MLKELLYRPVPPTAIGALVPSRVSSNSFLYDMKCVYHLFWGGLVTVYILKDQSLRDCLNMFRQFGYVMVFLRLPCIIEFILNLC